MKSSFNDIKQFEQWIDKNQLKINKFLPFSERLEVASDEYKLLKEFDVYNQ